MADFEKLMEKLDALEPLLDACGEPQLQAIAMFLADRIASRESFVTFLGEISSGKSTLINGLLQRKLLPVKACPTTGAISEIILTPDNSADAFYAVTRSAECREIDRDECMQLIEEPEEELARVRIVTHCPYAYLKNMRIFDTPGYDSIMSEHEEILKEFLPNSDVVIYTVSYKIGIQQNDYAFLGFLRELLREDAEIVLVINRCPAGTEKTGARIREIRQYASDILLCRPHCFLVPDVIPEDDSYPLPPAARMWEYVAASVSSERRRQALYDAFDGYILDIYNECRERILRKQAAMQLDADELTCLAEEQRKFAQRVRNAVNEILIPGFDRIRELIPGRINDAAENSKRQIRQAIADCPKAKMQEMIAYTNVHLMPFTIKREAEEVQHFIETYLEEINEQVDDYLNKEIEDFNYNISVKISTTKSAVIKSLASKAANRAGYRALLRYFGAFGGKGGANAGIANAASHALKKIGDLFGKTFARETHNSLKHFLAKIGATSMRTVGIAISVLIEAATLLIDYNTWQGRLSKQVGPAIDKWAEETIPTILNDLEELKQQNIRTITEIADEYEQAFDTDLQGCSMGEIEALVRKCDAVGKRIGVEI